MSLPEIDSSQCPACDASDFTEFGDRERRVCSNCGVVIDTVETTSNTNNPVEHQYSPTKETNSEDPSWKDKVKIEDKSDSDLVDLLSLTEEVAKEADLGDEAIIRSGEIVIRAWKDNFTHGRRRDETVASAVYIVSRRVNSAVPPGVLANIVETEKASIKDTYLRLKQELDLEVKPAHPSQFVEYICDQVGLSEALRNEAKTNLKNLKNATGNPIGIASGAIYASAAYNGEDVTLEKIGNVGNITKETVWRHSNKFKSDKGNSG